MTNTKRQAIIDRAVFLAWCRSANVPMFMTRLWHNDP